MTKLRDLLASVQLDEHNTPSILTSLFLNFYSYSANLPMVKELAKFYRREK